MLALLSFSPSKSSGTTTATFVSRAVTVPTEVPVANTPTAVAVTIFLVVAQCSTAETVQVADPPSGKLVGNPQALRFS